MYSYLLRNHVEFFLFLLFNRSCREGFVHPAMLLMPHLKDSSVPLSEISGAPYGFMIPIGGKALAPEEPRQQSKDAHRKQLIRCSFQPLLVIY